MNKPREAARLIDSKKGVFLVNLAKAKGLHKNTVLKWCARFKIPIMLMRLPDSRYFRRAIRSKDVERFFRLYKAMGGRV